MIAKEAIDPINVSALNQYAYCPRRCALIYLEGEFADNVHTNRGNAEHARVEYALPIWSERLRLIGKCDVVEFWSYGTIYPVEYKHGPRRSWLNDDVQLAAQALCLEEMLGVSVLTAAIFHAASKRRREVKISQDLRAEVEHVVNAIRRMLASQHLPQPITEVKRCRGCSLKDICQPEALKTIASEAHRRAALFDPDA
jgi:CRISPR-associated exonuclease Cas4